ncbi:regulatory protein RecX [Stakelama marina]|uniref:Regulatory protein RecX n=1 Tax=Stakelama marina TaxID=2826939 RepID=A0A8T4I7Y9_9SPHN|nr:regulatory protein RecX [Stakelama marina]MBR0551108.1 regulatory protein RecX [Stakelama marina]
MSRTRRKPPPLTAQTLEKLALRYVERYATTRAKLAGYLSRKLTERGFEDGTPDIDGIVARFAEFGYVDDRAFGEARARSMARRGLGARRVTMALRQAGIEGEDADALTPEIEERAAETAIAFARRRRIGPFGAEEADRATQEKQIAAMVRAGHGFEIARTLVRLAPGEDCSFLLDP